MKTSSSQSKPMFSHTKKTFHLHYFLGIIVCFLCFTKPVFAQFTLLPGTDLSPPDCKPIIDQFLIDGKMPSEAEEKKAAGDNSQLKDLSTQLEQKEKEREDKLALQNKAEEEAKSSQADVQKMQDEVTKLESTCSNDSADVATQVAACQNLDGALKDLDEAKKTNLDKEAALSVAKDDFNTAFDQSQQLSDQINNINNGSGKIGMRQNLLGCAIKTGRITLAMIPYFITYIINFVLSLIGLISVLFIVLGGYLYVFAGMSEDKDKGKKTIKNALMGMGIALGAWAIVNVILRAITG